MAPKSKPDGLVTIYPLRGAYIEGVRHVEQSVDAQRAEELLAWSPPAFSLNPRDERVINAEVAAEASPIEAAQEPSAVPSEG